MQVGVGVLVALAVSLIANVAMVLLLARFKKRKIELGTVVEKFKELARRFRDIVAQREESFYRNLLQVSASFVEDADAAFLVYFKGEDGSVVSLSRHSSSERTEVVSSEKTVKKTSLPLKAERVYVLDPDQSRRTLQLLGDGKFTDELLNMLVADIHLGGELKAKLMLLRRRSFTSEELDLVRTLSGLLSSFVATHNYISSQGRFQKDMVLTLIRILEYHDTYTKGHSKSVATLASLLAEKLGLGDELVKKTYWAALLHDIGKIVVPSHILNKEGRLTVEEFEVIRKHPVYGHDFLIASQELSELAKYVLHHHERWDGRGYPVGIAGDEIPLVSRIIAVADAFDAMRSDRPYRRGLPLERIRTELVEHAGKQFDPEVARILITMIDKREIN